LSPLSHGVDLQPGDPKSPGTGVAQGAPGDTDQPAGDATIARTGAGALRGL